MEMPPFDTELFIEEIESRPAIWNTYCSEYSNKNKKAGAWEEIGILFTKHFGEMDSAEKYQAGKVLLNCSFI